MAITGQSRTLIAILFLVFLANTSSTSTRAQDETVGAASSQGHVEIANDVQLTTDQQELLDFALSRFEGQGLVLPQIEVEFVADILECHGHKGLYWLRTRTLRMCSMDKKTMLHELAHAWANFNLTDAQQERFAELRSLEAWNDWEYDWEERATEHAAEIIAWALMDRPIHIRHVTETADGRQRAVYRLLTIDHTSVEEMCDAFVTLTGRQLVYRDAGECDSELLEIEWQAKMATLSSPEARGH
jgi:hypothetical protein